MASPQPTDSHTRISNELYTQILMRDFTKRQRAILDLIIRLSYGCGKKTAQIPLAKHFEICGVQANKVRRELNGLRALRVIDWAETDGLYWLNKDYDIWLAERPSQETEQTFNELLKTNIRNQHDQNGHAQNGQDDQKGHKDMTKKVSENGPKRSYDLPEIQSPARDEEVPITKDNYIDKKQVVVERSPIDTYLFALLKHGKEVFKPYDITQAVAYDMAELLTKEMLPVELGFAAIESAKKAGGNEGLARYKLRSWLQAGIKDATAAKQHDEEIFGGGTSHGINATGNRRASKTGQAQAESGNEDWAAIESKFFS